MGNVFASSAPPSQLPPPPQSFSQFIPSENDLTSAITNNNDNDYKNPGPMEELHRKCKGMSSYLIWYNLILWFSLFFFHCLFKLFSEDIFPMPFDGAKVMLNKALSNHFQVSHNIVIGSAITPPGYRFGATYIGTKQLSLSEAYPIFFGEIDPSGNLNSRFIHFIGNRLKLQVGAQIHNSKCVASQFNTDYLGPNYTASLVLGNLDPVNNSGVAVASYLQNVTNNLSLGSELVLQYNSPAVNSVLSVSGRYTSPSNYIVSGTLNNSGVQLCYYEKKNETLQVIICATFQHCK